MKKDSICIHLKLSQIYNMCNDWHKTNMDGQLKQKSIDDE